MTSSNNDLILLRQWIAHEAKQLGFDELRVADLDMSQAEPRLREWLAKGHHGDMNYMSEHADLRISPDKLQPGALRALCVRMSYLPDSLIEADDDWAQASLMQVDHPEKAVVAIYARGRDYHKVMRSRLQTLAEIIARKIGDFGYRVFVDSAPVLEVELAQKSGIGWRGKHTLALNREGGSYFFLGEILVDIPLPVDEPISSHCGQCQACIDVCPTKAIIAPYELDARRCISYLTIEHAGTIPEELRPLMGNRIYGCDDCQLICPWNKFAQAAKVNDFAVRHHLDDITLLELSAWTESDFLKNHEGSPIRRIGYERWTRNLVIGLGNALRSTLLAKELRTQMRGILLKKKEKATPMVIEHIEWALKQDCMVR